MITVTERASAKRDEAMREQPASVYGIRLEAATAGGCGPGCGCSSLTYQMYPDTSRPTATDTVVDRSRTRLLISEASRAALEGATIDFVENEAAGPSFTLVPVTSALASSGECGCDGDCDCDCECDCDGDWGCS